MLRGNEGKQSKKECEMVKKHPKILFKILNMCSDKEHYPLEHQKKNFFF